MFFVSLCGVQSKYILLICATKTDENLPIIAHFLIFCAVFFLFYLCFSDSFYLFLVNLF